MARILYFSTLAERLGKTAEELKLPPGVQDIQGLLAFLRKRGEEWPVYLIDDRIQATVNRNFAELNAGINDLDEIGLMLSRR
ncbi:MAG: MoaD/ThiS family protein [Sulfuricella denitrificans]|nr:MoaD/ThiS family protein [Sulfuricella denitrificans]